MRIGIFTDDFLPRESGVVTSILHLRRGLIERGHEVYIIAPAVPGYQDALTNIIRLPSVNSLVFPDIRIALPRRKYTQQLVDLNFDIIHTQTQYNVGLFGYTVAKTTGCPHISTAHSVMAELIGFYPAQMVGALLLYSQLYLYFFGLVPPLNLQINNDIIYGNNLAGLTSRGLSLLKRRVWVVQNHFLSNVDHVIVPSAHTLTDLKRSGLQTPATAVPNGIDTDFFREVALLQHVKRPGIQVVSVGRLSAEKRQDTLIRAVAGNPNVRLELIGDGPERKAYEKLAKHLGLSSERVQFYGSRDQAFIRSRLAEADLFALASHNFDTQGLVLIEAAAAGLPVVYCDPKLKESVSRHASFLVDPTAQGFGDLFTTLARDKTQLLNMHTRATEYADTHHYQNFANQVESVYIAASAG